MPEHFTQLYFFFDLIAFLSVIFVHLVKTNRNMIRLYVVQSFAVALVLIGLGLAEGERSLLLIGTLTLLIKGIMAPIFFARLMRRFGSRFTVNSYLSTPVTLLVLMLLVLFSYSRVFLPLSSLVPQALGLLSLNIAIILIALFVVINRRGAFSQIIGVLSLENGILLLASFIGIKQPLALEMGIIFDIVVWMIIAHVFISLIYKQFGSLNTDKMKNLIEE